MSSSQPDDPRAEEAAVTPGAVDDAAVVSAASAICADRWPLTEDTLKSTITLLVQGLTRSRHPATVTSAASALDKLCDCNRSKASLIWTAEGTSLLAALLDESTAPAAATVIAHVAIGIHNTATDQCLEEIAKALASSLMLFDGAAGAKVMNRLNYLTAYCTRHVHSVLLTTEGALPRLVRALSLQPRRMMLYGPSVSWFSAILMAQCLKPLQTPMVQWQRWWLDSPTRTCGVMQQWL